MKLSHIVWSGRYLVHKDKILEYQRDVIFEYLNEAINLVTASNVYMLANDKHRSAKKD